MSQTASQTATKEVVQVILQEQLKEKGILNMIQQEQKRMSRYIICIYRTKL